MGTGFGLALVDALNFKIPSCRTVNLARASEVEHGLPVTEVGLAPRCAASAAPLVILVPFRRAAPLEASFSRPLHAGQSTVTCPLHSPDCVSARKLPRVVVHPRHEDTFY